MKQKTNEKLISEKDGFKFVIIDLLFTFIPIIILLFLRAITSNLNGFFEQSDWSFISMILFGQTLVKVFSGISDNENKKNTATILLHFSLILLFGLIPSVVFMVVIELGMKSILVIICQFTWLVASILIYGFFGTIGYILSMQKRITNNDFIPK
jgi:hypothetical protein